MPPQRTIPPAKAMKTERTHEENQERAYIAASRRSDRSLEARVESARRASVIHKRRTGRSLRVTEQDVINEEMYEEEDDDLPLHYRRLTAHLQTGSPDFNRRLAAYLTNHVAMRSALDQAITTSYAQQYPNAPQFAHNRTMYPSPFPVQGIQSPTSPSAASRGIPYPSPGSLTHRPGIHGRSASITNPQESASPNGSMLSDRNRRMSMPQGPISPTSQPMFSPLMQSDMTAQHPAFDMGAMQQQFGPLSTALPPESQMMLGPALDRNDPLTSMLMAGSENLSQLSDAMAANPIKQQQPQFGIGSTLAPSAMHNYPVGDGVAADFGFGFGTGLEPRKIPTLSREGSSHDSTDPLALENDWNAFIDDNSWEQNAT
ncbi:MAG: hypothetical protein M1814_001341 [Vezdaea aestivalis]|nr:MAG: hypothetical protein M1814_001341 [Vezdaea aestivalis]